MSEENGHNDRPLDNILKSRVLSEEDFLTIGRIIYDLCRINLHAGKKELVQARMNKRLRQLGMDTYGEYLKYLEEDETGREIANMVDILSTNLTYFFREPDHFEYLKDELARKQRSEELKRLRIWSAGCSSGEEAYTIAMVLRESVRNLDRIDSLILATDISTRMLAVAKEGIYKEQRFRDTPQELKEKYFELFGREEGCKVYKPRTDLSSLVRFRYLNLMDEWPMKGKMDVIFCRNVMIYFDKPTQSELVRRFYEAVRPGGIFIVGHSESLTGIKNDFRYENPTIYRKDK